MKKFIVSIVLTILFFSFACQKGVQAETATCFGMSVSIATQTINIDPAKMIKMSVWSQKGMDGEFVPGRWFFEKKYTPTASGDLPYNPVMGEVIVNKGDFLKLSLFCNDISPEDVLCTFCRVCGGGMSEPITLINQRYLKRFNISVLNQDTFQSIADQVEDMSDEEIIKLNTESVFYFDTTLCPNNEDLVFQFGVMHRAGRNRITIFLFSWETKERGCVANNYSVGLMSPLSGLPIQGLHLTGENSMSGISAGYLQVQTITEAMKLREAYEKELDAYYKASTVNQPTETSNPEKNREVNFLDLKDGQEFEVYQNSALLVNMGQYDGFQVLNPETGKVYFEHTFTDKESHGIQFPYDSLDGSLAIKIVAPDGASRVIVLKKMKGSEKSEKI